MHRCSYSISKIAEEFIAQDNKRIMKAVLFVLGFVADRVPQLVERIAESGHYVFYIHPWELDTEHPVIETDKLTKNRH